MLHLCPRTVHSLSRKSRENPQAEIEHIINGRVLPAITRFPGETAFKNQLFGCDLEIPEVGSKSQKLKLIHLWGYVLFDLGL